MRGSQSGPKYVPGQMSNEGRDYANELVNKYYGLKPGPGPVSNYQGTAPYQSSPWMQGSSGIDYGNFLDMPSSSNGVTKTSAMMDSAGGAAASGGLGALASL